MCPNFEIKHYTILTTFKVAIKLDIATKFNNYITCHL